MKTVRLGREYYPLSEVSWRWLQQNAPSTSWEQMFGYTTLNFEDEAVALQFRKYMKRKLNENPSTQ